MPGDRFPAEHEIADLVPRPGSLTWRVAGDVRLLATAGYALALQVSHPTVGAGVSEHSSFRAQPWPRLVRTLDFVNLMVYGGPAAAARAGRRLRETHRHIHGVRPDGTHYSALEPEAYAWVHATLAEGIVTGNRWFVSPLRAAEVEQFLREWCGLGRLLGIRPGELPQEWGDFRRYFDEMVGARLAATDALADVLAALARPAAPPLPILRGRAWGAVRAPLARALSLATVGLMPAVLRERAGVSFEPARGRELRMIAAATRGAGPLMPAALRVYGPTHLRVRRRQIARSYPAPMPGLS